MLKINAVQLDIPAITEQQWHDLLNARAQFIIESRPDDPAPSHDDQRQFLTKIPEFRDRVVFWLLYDENANCVGFCSMQYPKPRSPDYATNKDRVYVEPVVLAPYRRQSVGTQILPLIAKHAQEVGASWVQWDTKFESGFRFSEKLGATEAGRQETNRLTIVRVYWALMQHWVDTGQSRNPAVELLRFDHLPNSNWIASLCDLITAINRLQPSDDVEGMSYTLTPEEFVKETQRLEEQKIARVIFCTREPDNTLSGMTDMFYNDAKPIHARISLTGVRSEFQAMRSINQRMGFTLFEQYVFYKMKVRDLAAKVDMSALD